MNIAILGCGPSGLLAAYAAEREGHSVAIYSIAKKSPMPGAVHLHDQIPGLTDAAPEYQITYEKIGNAEGYAQKVYGRPDAPCSFKQFPEGQRDSWSMRALYDKLWDKYGFAVHDKAVDYDLAESLAREFDLVISSIPAKILCGNPYHSFPAAKVWFSDEFPVGFNLPDGHVLFNGHPAWEWYRASNINGHQAMESPTPFPGSYSGFKPIQTDCDCLPQVARVGRFGRWQKGILVHHAFQQANEIINNKAGARQHV